MAGENAHGRKAVEIMLCKVSVLHHILGFPPANTIHKYIVCNSENFILLHKAS